MFWSDQRFGQRAENLLKQEGLLMYIELIVFQQHVVWFGVVMYVKPIQSLHEGHMPGI